MYQSLNSNESDDTYSHFIKFSLDFTVIYSTDFITYLVRRRMKFVCVQISSLSCTVNTTSEKKQ